MSLNMLAIEVAIIPAVVGGGGGGGGGRRMRRSGGVGMGVVVRRHV